MKDDPRSHDVRRELDRMIVSSFTHYETAQRRRDIDSNLMQLGLTPSPESTAESSLSHSSEKLPKRGN